MELLEFVISIYLLPCIILSGPTYQNGKSGKLMMRLQFNSSYPLRGVIGLKSGMFFYRSCCVQDPLRFATYSFLDKSTAVRTAKQKFPDSLPFAFMAGDRLRIIAKLVQPPPKSVSEQFRDQANSFDAQ